MRLDKYISHTTGLSRAASRRAIKAAAVQVNEITADSAQQNVSATDCITLNGERLSLPGQQYWMLHKPAGFVCATADGENPTVLDLLTTLPDNIVSTLGIAGRLDKDTTGLVLLSSDGPWIHRLTSPRHEHRKTYVAHLERAVEARDIEHFARGVMLKGENKLTRPAQLIALPDRRAQITISEGRYHQIKRMFAATGNRVLALHRQSVGDISLDDNLRAGDYRPLSPAEIASVT